MATQATLIELQRDQLTSKDQLLAEQSKLIALVDEQNAELRRRVGMDSTNSSLPPATDSIAAKAKRRNVNSQRERSADRKPGRQQGHPGSGLELATEAELADTVPVEPAECSTCAEHLSTSSADQGDA